jgi:hypothetical protein
LVDTGDFFIITFDGARIDLDVIGGDGIQNLK